MGEPFGEVIFHAWPRNCIYLHLYWMKVRKKKRYLIRIRWEMCKELFDEWLFPKVANAAITYIFRCCSYSNAHGVIGATTSCTIHLNGWIWKNRDSIPTLMTWWTCSDSGHRFLPHIEQERKFPFVLHVMGANSTYQTDDIVRSVYSSSTVLERSQVWAELKFSAHFILNRT